MADLAKIHRNVGRLVHQGAPEADIDQYLSEEGVTYDDYSNYINESKRPIYAASSETPEMDSDTGFIRTALDKFNQGTTSGFGENITDPIGIATSALMSDPIGFWNGEVTDPKLTEQIVDASDATKRTLKSQSEKRPYVSGAGELIGALTGGVAAADIASSVLPGKFVNAATEFIKNNPIKASSLIGAAQAGLYGAGTSDSDTLGGVALDTAVPAVAGAVLGPAGYMLGKKSSRYLSERARGALDKIKGIGILDDGIDEASEFLPGSVSPHSWP